MIDYIVQLTGLPRKRIIQGGILLVLVMMFFGLGQALVTNFIGVAYPCFMSFYSIETTTSQEDDKQWLTYWVVFGVLSLAE